MANDMFKAGLRFRDCVLSQGVPAEQFSALVRDLCSDQPTLKPALLDLVGRPLFCELPFRGSPAQQSLARDALLADLQHLYRSEVLEALMDFIEGALGYTEKSQPHVPEGETRTDPETAAILQNKAGTARNTGDAQPCDSNNSYSSAVQSSQGRSSEPASLNLSPAQRAGIRSEPFPAPGGRTSGPLEAPMISLAGLGLLLAGGGLAAAWFRLGWRPPTSLVSPQLHQLTSVAAQLCEQPKHIDELLNIYGRRAFTTLRADASQRRRLLDLATGASEADQITPGQIEALVAWVMAPIPPADQLQRLGACPELSQELERALERWKGPSAKPAPQAGGAASSPNR